MTNKICDVCGSCFNGRGRFCQTCSPRTKNYERVKAMRQAFKRAGVKILGGKCCICGYDKCLNALSFHHVDPKSKTYDFNHDVFNWDVYKAELSKCILVCNNCHAEIHAKMQSEDQTKSLYST